MARIFYVHWEKAEALSSVKDLRATGHTVQYEFEDGEAAWKKIKAAPPDVLVISLARMPSHGQRTAEVLRSSRKLGRVALLFTDGEPAVLKAAKKAFPEARFTTENRLNTAIEALLGEIYSSPHGTAESWPAAK